MRDPGVSLREVSGPVHLIGRFFGSLIPIGAKAVDIEWIAGVLTPAEFDLWVRQRPADRRHSAAVARRVERALGAEATGPVLAAALLHDIGKIDSRLGTYGRVIATLSGKAVGHDPDIIRAWTKTTGITRRVGLYLQHARLGGDMLELVGSDALTVAWTREHHLPEAEWSVEQRLARALKDADDD